jgi:hypothetical protein
MKLDNSTVNVLKNFATINPSILIKEGNVLSTISPTKTILARSVVKDTFPKRFAIYELSKFLGGFSLIDNAELEFNDTNLRITNGNGKNVQSTYSEESTIKTPPEKDVVLPSVDVLFTLTDEALKDVLKASGSLGLPEIAIVGDGTNVLLRALESKNPSGNTYDIKVGTTEKSFRVIFKTENLLKVISGNYEVSVSSKGISHFKGENTEYWIAVESSYSFA